MHMCRETKGNVKKVEADVADPRQGPAYKGKVKLPIHRSDPVAVSSCTIQHCTRRVRS
jgi:hypothetical protein